MDICTHSRADLEVVTVSAIVKLIYIYKQYIYIYIYMYMIRICSILFEGPEGDLVVSLPLQ